ncbi:MAG: hypothetical protein KJ070_25875, partial [Verrucomicrobia bacterium]|nr:hypothetical protein [Verrucomicrobiota bacterium]
MNRIPLTRRDATLSPSGGESRVRERFMESLHDAGIAHRDHQPLFSTRARLGLRQPSAAVEDEPVGEGGRGLPHSKPLRSPERFMASTCLQRVVCGGTPRALATQTRCIVPVERHWVSGTRERRQAIVP